MNFLVLLLPIVSLLSATNELGPTDAQKWNLKGKVKSIKEATYVAPESNGNVTSEAKGFWIKNYHTFSQQGMMIESQTMEEDGSVAGTLKKAAKQDGTWETTSILYGNFDHKQISYLKDNLVQKNESFDKEGKLMYTMNYTYAPNKLTTVFVIGDGSVYLTVVDLLDDKNNILESVSTDANGEVTKTIYKRNEAGDVIEKQEITSKNPKPVIVRYKYEYDKKQNWTKLYQSNEAGKVTTIATRELEYYS